MNFNLKFFVNFSYYADFNFRSPTPRVTQFGQSCMYMVMNKIYKRNDIIFLTFNVIFKLKELSTFSGDFPRHIKRWWFSEMFMFSINYQTERLANMCWSKTCIKNLKIVLVTKIQSGRGFIMIEFFKIKNKIANKYRCHEKHR